MIEMRSQNRAGRLWFAALVVFLVAPGCSKTDAARLGTGPDVAAHVSRKPLELLDLDGKSFDFWRQGLDRVSVVMFTRTDCPISNRLIPEVCRLHAVYQSRGVDFYLVYVDPHESPDDIRRHLSEYRIPCQALRDPRHDLANDSGATITPEAVVYGRDEKMTYRGRVNDLYVDIGRARAEPTTHDLADAIEATVLGRPVAVPRTEAVGCKIEDLAQ